MEIIILLSCRTISHILMGEMRVAFGHAFEIFGARLATTVEIRIHV